MRPTITEDPRVLLEEHEAEQRELAIRQHIIEVCVLLLDPCCGPDCEDRDFYRYELRLLRREERRLQRFNNTQLVLDSKTYDAENGSCDEQAEVLRADLQRLPLYGITVPESACLVDESVGLESGWYADPELQTRWI